MESVTIQRYNIYSGLSVKYGSVELCFDPAKICKQDLYNINPDFIFISHESMDHLDPFQVYVLQKKKNCDVFCSIAAAADLVQFFPNDTDFKEHIHALIPGSYVTTEKFVIEAEKSIHCDYMMPIVIKITDRSTKISILHCFDSFLSGNIVELSKNTDIAIVPLGIAKGISGTECLSFIDSLHSRYFVTNHFKSRKELNDFRTITDNHDKCFYVDWNEKCCINVEGVGVVDTEKAEFNENKSEINVAEIISNFSDFKYIVLNDETFLKKIFEAYKDSEYKTKIKLIFLYTLIALVDASVIDEQVIDLMKSDFLTVEIPDENNCLHAVILFFLGIYAQQSSKSCSVDFGEKLKSANEHVIYWFTEYLGRSITSSKENNDSVNKLIEIISNSDFYNSVVIRRRIFWELHRVMKTFPMLAKKFMKTFEDGLVDQNPDVRLLAVLCFSLADKTMVLDDNQLEKILLLLSDEEEDVRENTVKIARDLKNRTFVMKGKDKICFLLNDHDCHVKNEAELTVKALTQ